MKQVILMRHAKSDWNNRALTDHQRPLNGRGKRDAPVLGTEIVKYGIIPEVILVSDAQRTKETWELLHKNFPNAKTVFLSELYHASANTLVNTIKTTDNLVDTLMIIAHNPGMTNVFSYLADIFIDNVPTSGVGCLTFHTDDFAQVLDCKKELTYFTYPKKIGLM